jgi:Calpain family cysteine protease
MNRKSNLPAVENLEGRVFMSGSPLSLSEVAFNGGTQLRINGTAGSDQITVAQTAAGLVVANGSWTKTVTEKLNSLYINGQGGNNSILLDASVTIDATIFAGTGKNVVQAGSGNDTLVSLGSTADTLIGGSGHDNFWTDNSAAEKVQNVNGGDVHRVSGFYNVTTTTSGKKISAARAKALAALKEPAVNPGLMYASFSNDPIFATTGPSANDVFQGNVGDCYYLSVLSSVAKVDPTRLTDNILNMGDGSVVVQLQKAGKPVFVHEDEMLPVYGNGALAYAGLGQENCTWVALMEKAWTYVRNNKNSYAGIDSGWMDESYQALGCNSTSTFQASSATALLSQISKDLASGQSVTDATTDTVSTQALVADHAYMVDSVGLDSHGDVATLTLRNPWGCNADFTGNGYVTITAAQALASMTGFSNANV